MFSLLPIEEIDTFVLSGCSAGGLAVFTWVDYVRNMILSKNPNVKFFGFPDSGFFMDYESILTKDNDYTIRMKELYKIVNKEIDYPN